MEMGSLMLSGDDTEPYGRRRDPRLARLAAWSRVINKRWPTVALTSRRLSVNEATERRWMRLYLDCWRLKAQTERQVRPLSAAALCWRWQHSVAGGPGPTSEGESPSAPRFLQRWAREGDQRVMERAPWPGRRLMQRFPPPSLGLTVDGHARPRTSLFEDRVLGVGRVSSCCIDQGDDRAWVQLCTVAVPMRSNWSDGTDRSPLVGCSISILILEK